MPRWPDGFIMVPVSQGPAADTFGVGTSDQCCIRRLSFRTNEPLVLAEDHHVRE